MCNADKAGEKGSVQATDHRRRHLVLTSGRKEAVYNPRGLPDEDLPVIYGFNNGGSDDWWSGALVAEDGTYLGGHVCSHEAYMPHDLGILEGARPDRHLQDFRLHYPRGYRMEFVGSADMEGHVGLQLAIGKARGDWG